MKLHPLLITAYLLGAAAVTLPIAGAMRYADSQSLHDLESRANLLAAQALHRNEQITAQVFLAVREMEAQHFEAPCSAQARSHMGLTLMKSSWLQAVGYIQGNRLLCSSMGELGENIELGEPEYLSTGGLLVRADRRFPFNPDALYRISTSALSGYAAIVHTDNAFDRSDTQVEQGLGLIGTSNLRPISKVGIWRPEWATRLGQERAVAFFDGDYIVALKASLRYAYFSYAAIPATELDSAWRREAQTMVPLGVLAGLLLALSVYLVTKQQMGLPAQLRTALKRGEFHLVYQPIVETGSGRWVGAEALLRWSRPRQEAISPAVFVPEAERHGLIGRLTCEVIRQVERDLGRLLRQQPEFFVSINFAASDLTNPVVMDHLSRAIHDMGIPTANLHIEATERTFVHGDAARQQLQALRALGVSLSIDDFGTGYSSLAYLTRLDVNCLKIDKTFVDPIGTGAVTASVIDHIIGMAQSLHLDMIAEGVETEAQRDYLLQRGVSMAQGWLFSRPLPARDLIDGWLRQSAPS